MEFVMVVLVSQLYKQFIEVFKFRTPLFYQPLATANPTQAILNCALSFLDSQG